MRILMVKKSCLGLFMQQILRGVLTFPNIAVKLSCKRLTGNPKGISLLFPSPGFNAVKLSSEVIHPECKNCRF